MPATDRTFAYALIRDQLAAMLAVRRLPAPGVSALGGAFATLSDATGMVQGGPAAHPETLEQRGALVGALTESERADAAKTTLQQAGARDITFEKATQTARSAKSTQRGDDRDIKPDKLARHVFILTLVYVLAVVGSISFFIRPI